MDGAPWLRRPVGVDSDQVETLIENKQRYNLWEIANILTISKSVRSLLKTKSVSFILQKKTYKLFGQPNMMPLTLLHSQDSGATSEEGSETNQ